MATKIESSALRSAITWAARAIQPKPSQPLLAAAVLDTVDGMLHVSGFDGSTYAVAYTEAASDLGRVLVPGHVMRSMVEQLDGLVTLEMDGALRLTAGRVKFRLNTMAADYYPAVAPLPAVAGTISADDLREIATRTAAAAGSGNGEDAILACAIFEAKDGHIRSTATDKYRLHRAQWTWKGDDFKVLVPARDLADIAKDLRGDVQILLAEEAGMIGFADQTRAATLGIIDAGRMLNVEPLFAERKGTVVITAARADLAAAIKSASVASDKNGHVTVRPEGEVLMIASRAEDGQGDGAVEVSADVPSEAVPIVLDASYMADALAALPGTHVRMEMPPPGNQGLVKIQGLPSAEGEPITSVTTLVMSVRPKGE